MTARDRRRAVVAGLVIASLALVPLASSVADRVVRDRAEKMATRLGVQVTLGEVSLGLRRLVTVNDVNVEHNGRQLAEIAALRADVPLWSLLTGHTRPELVEFVGLKARVRVVDRRIPALEKLLARLRHKTGKTPSTGTESRGLTLRLVDSMLTVDIAGQGRPWLGTRATLTRLDAELSRAGGRVSASLKGAVDGRVHAWLDRSPEGKWSARVEAAPEVTWRAPVVLPLGIQRLSFRGAAWDGELASLTGLEVGSTAGQVRFASISADRQLRKVQIKGVTAKAIVKNVSALPELNKKLAAIASFRGALNINAQRVSITGLRQLMAGRAGELDVGGLTVSMPAYKTRLTLARATVASPASGITAVVSRPQLTIGQLTKVKLPKRLWPAKKGLQRLSRLWTAAQKASRKITNTAGWARPVDPAMTPALEVKARRRRAKARRKNRGKPAYTARYAKPLITLRADLDRIWQQASRYVMAVASLPLNLSVRGGSVRVHTGDLRLGGEAIDLHWRSAQGQPTLRLHLRPRVAEVRGGSVALNVDGDKTGLAQVALTVEGSAVARMVSGLDTRLALGARPHLGLHVTAMAQAGRGGVVRGRVTSRHLGVDWDRFAPGPVTAFSVDAPFELRWPARRNRIQLDTGHIRFGGSGQATQGRATVMAHLSGGRRPVIDMTLTLPDQDCGVLLSALPTAMLPTLGRVSARGRLSGWLDLRFDVAHPYYSELDFGLKDKRCKDLKLDKIDVAELDGEFVRKVNEDGKILDHVKIGPASDAWAKLGKVPSWVPYAMITTEDGGFWRHRGLNAFLLNRAIRLDLHYGRFVYGGSTITQQLAKNLFFTRSKFLARKLEELLAVWAMERGLAKVRIIEIYMNAVEFAPHVYGVTRGAMHYFGKRASRLTPLEAAWLGSIKPCPRCGNAAFRQFHYRRWYQTRLLEILTRMHRNGVITDEQFAKEANTVPQFARWPEEKLSRRYSHPIPDKKPPAIARLDRGRRKK
ncbi:MAG: transglycosylase domain-containing protein [Myxococcales bacterium]|nr:transglycosylase domain-containing protein [Myxococcales bacterium]